MIDNDECHLQLNSLKLHLIEIEIKKKKLNKSRDTLTVDPCTSISTYFRSSASDRPIWENTLKTLFFRQIFNKQSHISANTNVFNVLSLPI